MDKIYYSMWKFSYETEMGSFWLIQWSKYFLLHHIDAKLPKCCEAVALTDSQLCPQRLYTAGVRPSQASSRSIQVSSKASSQ